MKTLLHHSLLILVFLFSLSLTKAQNPMQQMSETNIAVFVNDTVVMRLGEYVGEFVQWQSSFDQIIWLDIPATNADTLLFASDEPATLNFRAKVVAGCCDPFLSDVIVVNVFHFPSLTTQTVTGITALSATSGGNISNDGGSPVTEKGIVWHSSQMPTLMENLGYTQNGTGTGTFEANITGLSANSTYYVRAYATTLAGTSYGQQVNFITLNGIIELTTNTISEITANTATGGGNITTDGGAPVTARGLVWNTAGNPTLGNNTGMSNNGSGTGEFVSMLTNLSPLTTYFARAYATNSVATQYGNAQTFTTKMPKPVANFTANITTGQVPLIIQFNDQSTNTPTGWSWNFGDGNTSTQQHPQHTYAVAGTYTVSLTATNEGGSDIHTKTNYIEAVPQPILPTVSTQTVTGIGATQATSGGNVTHDGYAIITARGVCWSTTAQPTLDDDYTTNGSGTGPFTSSVTNLQPNTTYYLRAYATNSAGTGFGEQRTFTTLSTTPTVLTAELTFVGATTATGGGNVTSDGGATVTARGVCWSTSQNPTTNDSHTTDGTGEGDFVSNLTGLLANTTYYIRAYAINTHGLRYGQQLTFTTATTPTVLTAEVSDILTTTATCGGNVTASGGAAVTARGIVWSTAQTPTVTTNQGITTNGSGTGTFTSQLTGLTQGTTYYVRAYATNEAGTNYGMQRSFTTILPPTVTTAPVSYITNNSANCGGEVTSDGGSPVIARGVCWHSAPNPTIENDSTQNGTGTGQFTSNITGLNYSTTYYVRAYVTTAAGTSYGEEFSFTTPHRSYIRMADFPGPLRESAITFSVNGKGYYGLGYHYSPEKSTTYNDIWEYDPVENTWTQKNDFPGGAISEAVGFAIDEYGYVGTGNNLNSFWQYNPTTDQWAQMQDFGGVGRSKAVGLSLNGKGIIGLGHDGVNFLSDFWEYDPLTNTWVQISNFNSPRWKGYEFVINDLAFVGGGWSISYPNHNHFYDLHEYDPSANQWSSKTNFPNGWRTYPLSFSLLDYGYVGLGFSAEKYVTQDIWQYNSLTNSWIRKSDFPLTARYSAVAIVINNKAFVGLGAKEENNEYLFDFWQYDPSLEEPTVPVVITSEVSIITDSTATSGGNIIDNGNMEITARGVVWSTTNNPTVEENEGITNNGTGVGIFVSEVTELQTNTRYFLKAYATNGIGTAYGELKEFVIVEIINGNGATDIDGNVYSSVIIGEQEWLVENLKVLKYNNGDEIPQKISDSDWNATTDYGAWCYDQNNSSNNDHLGKLYNGFAVNDVRKICPSGWHVPVDEEWTTLVEFIDPYAITNNDEYSQSTLAGRKLKSIQIWEEPNDADNEYGFSALPGGHRASHGIFAEPNKVGYWWTASNYLFANYNRIRVLTNTSSTIGRHYQSNTYGMSVRCMRHANGYPTVTTQKITNISADSACSGGNVHFEGASTIIARGLVWSTSENPTVENHVGITNEGQGLGEFSHQISGLQSTTTYYVRAYATNSNGTAYGEQRSFNTIAENQVMDFEGKIYQTVVIGQQIWMAENLRSQKLNDGTDIPPSGGQDWGYVDYAAWTTCPNSFGFMYNGYAAANSKLCPTGWHVPTENEYLILADFLGGVAVAGGKMKNVGTEYWAEPNTGATNESNFSGMPGGAKWGLNPCGNETTDGYYWTQNLSRYVQLKHDSAELFMGGFSERFGLSVRCVKN